MNYLIVLSIGIGLIVFSLSVYFLIKHFYNKKIEKNSINYFDPLESKSFRNQLKFTNDCEDLGEMVDNLERHSIKINYDYRK